MNALIAEAIGFTAGLRFRLKHFKLIKNDLRYLVYGA